MKVDDFAPAGTVNSPASLPAPHTITHRRKIGAFYTPLNVAEILCQWAVRTADDAVFEPCFGGCTFLEALYSRLKVLGQVTPEKRLFGCDIDPLAFKYLENFGDISQQRENFVLNDFLAISDLDLPTKFDVIIGNPPYIRHSKFDQKQKATVTAWSRKYNIDLNGRASLWAYFILHATNFLKIGGRVAWVLPATFLTSAYATQVRQLIASCFEYVTAITLTERLFVGEGTEESTVILLADGFSEPHEPRQIFSHCVDTVVEMEALIKGLSSAPQIGLTLDQHGSGMLPIDAINIFKNFNCENVSTLKDWATVHIGLVTGNLPFFIKSKKNWELLGIKQKYLTYITPKTKWLHGINLAEKDIFEHIEGEIPCLALNCIKVPSTGTLRNYLSKYDQVELESNATFKKRDLWHYFFDDKIPDAFLAFMTHLGPRMIINNARSNCTNSLYRVFFNKDIPFSQKMLIAITLHTTYTQFSAEYLGQGRGSGALKLEPSHSLALRLFLPQKISVEMISNAFAKLDDLLRLGRSEDAREFADKFIFGESTEINKSVQILDRGLKIGRTRRMRVAG